jgi:hypothetical protein
MTVNEVVGSNSKSSSIKKSNPIVHLVCPYHLPTPLPLEISTCNIVEVLEDEQEPQRRKQ